MHTPYLEKGITTKDWLEESFTIHLSQAVSPKTARRMQTKGQEIRGRHIRVRDGFIRDTSCGLIACKDRFGMPFVWHKKLIRAVVRRNGRVLWEP